MSIPRIHFDEPVGSGPMVVLGPSLGTSTVLWSTVLPLLADHFTLLAWDLPGHGRSPAPTGPFSVADLADAVARGIEKRVDRPVRYAGVSLGGATGLQLALRHPEFVDRLAVLASGARLGTPVSWAERIETVRGQSTSALVSASAQRWFAAGTPRRRPELTGTLLHALQDASDDGYIRCCEALAGYDVRDRLGDIDVPTLVVWGAEDTVAPEEKAAELAAGIPRVRVERVDEAAHLPPAEQPEIVARLLREFFDPRPTRPEEATS